MFSFSLNRFSTGRRFKSFALAAAIVVALSLTARAESASTQRFTIADIVRLAEKNNVDLRIARAKTEEARGKALQDAADLLPELTATARQARVFKVNLAAQGFASFPGIDPLLGPFNSFDARAQVVQKLLEVSAIQRYRSAGRATEITRLREQLVRDQVAAAAALACLDVLRAQKSVDTAQASVKLARALLDKARDQKQAGAAAGIDLARAETRAAEEDLRFLQTESDLLDSQTRLKRMAGLPFDQPILLSDRFEFAVATAPAVAEAIEAAAGRRVELRVAKQLVEQERLALSGDHWASAPSLSVAGDYGASGTTPRDAHGTGSIGVQASMSILSEKNHGKSVEARGRLDEAEARANDQRAQVEEDVRLALDELRISSERAKTADQAVKLAERELKMAEDRFSAGVADNLEVVNAQTSLARVQDTFIAALAAYEATRINLAMALGRMPDFQF